MKILDFLNKLDEKKLFYTISKSRDFGIEVIVHVPSEKWEIDFLYENEGEECSDVWVERYKSDGQICDESELDILFRDFSD